MKNKRTYKKIIKSLYNAACIAETISALEEKASIITENMLFYNCVEEDHGCQCQDRDIFKCLIHKESGI